LELFADIYQMARSVITLLLLGCLHTASAQNLVANGDFEDRNTCYEYHVFCAAEAWFRIPLAPVSAINGTAGFLSTNHYENVLVENSLSRGIARSFIYTKLLCPLEKGKTYFITASFHSENGPFDSVNILLSDFEPYHYPGKMLHAPATILTITPKQVSDEKRKEWKEYTISFTAIGNEKYLLVGNLSPEAVRPKKRRGQVIYNIDNVSLKPAGKQDKGCPEKKDNQRKLYDNNFRHTPHVYLDDDEPVPPRPKPELPPKTTTPVPKTDTPVATITPAPVNDTLVIPDVLFKFDRSELNPDFSVRLDTLIQKIRNKVFKRIEVLGHTDSLGNDAYNQRLSKARAETVKQYLVDRLHYPADIIVTKAFAATLPVSTNRTSAGRQKNRRVEIVLIR
jgi:outer membrane protein OmpA-like peptidoglycan-associated protein